MQEISLGYDPRTQFIPFHQRNSRFSCIVAHRRAGKTVACINDMLARALYTTKKNARYAYIAPFYRQAKDVAWQYLKDFGAPVAAKIREPELRVELKTNGAWITLYGADNPDALRGLYFDGVILDEYGDCRPSLWGQVILPTLVDRRGWAVFIGTPKGKNHFYDVHLRSQQEEGWYHSELPASKTGLISQDELDEIRAITDENEYLQEFECSFEAAVKGTYYAELMNEVAANFNHKNVYNPEYGVHVFADLGRSDSTAFWFNQITTSGAKMADYEEAQGKDLEFYFALLESKGYDYETFFLPHDARAKTLQTKKTTIEQFVEWAKIAYPKATVRIVPRLSVQHGIEASRWAIRRTDFDVVECKDGIEALRAYKRKYNELTKAFSDTPDHTWASDGSDAFRYYAIMLKTELLQAQKRPTIQDRVQLLDRPVEMKLSELWEARDAQLRRESRFRRI